MSLYIMRVLVSYARVSSKKHASQMSTSVEQVSSLYTTFAMASRELTQQDHCVIFNGIKFGFTISVFFSAHLQSYTLISRRDIIFHVVAYLPILDVVLIAVPLSPGMNLVDDRL
jgi:hypothetical protein